MMFLGTCSGLSLLVMLTKKIGEWFPESSNMTDQKWFADTIGMISSEGWLDLVNDKNKMLQAQTFISVASQLQHGQVQIRAATKENPFLFEIAYKGKVKSIEIYPGKKQEVIASTFKPFAVRQEILAKQIDSVSKESPYIMAENMEHSIAISHGHVYDPNSPFEESEKKLSPIESAARLLDGLKNDNSNIKLNTLELVPMHFVLKE